MENKTIEIKKLERLEDLDSLQQGEIVGIQIEDRIFRGVYYDKFNYKFGGLCFEFLDPERATKEKTTSLEIGRGNISVQDDIAKIVRPRITALVHYYNRGSDCRLEYEKRMDVIEKSGIRK